MENKVVIQYGTVEPSKDEYDGMRIRVRLNQDRDIPDMTTNAFPLLPKTIQSPPKTGEGVLVFTMELGNNQSQRFYIGPIISQPQFFEKDNFSLAQGQESQQATSLVNGAGNSRPVPALSHFAETVGSFPAQDSVAIIGRKGEDIEIKDDEINIRCGIRVSPEAYSVTDKDLGLFGRVVFNGMDPAYIQLKYNNGGVVSGGTDDTNTNSIINMVAGKLNLISTNDEAYTDRIRKTIKNENNEYKPFTEMLDSTDYAKLMDDLHQLPYGDVLFDLLTKFLQIFMQHTHDWAGLPPNKKWSEYIGKEVIPLLNEMLSKHVRIS